MKSKGRKILISLLILICLFIACVLTIMNTPQIIFNSFVFGKAAQYAKTFGIDVEWKKLDIDTKSMGFLDKRIKITFDGLCAAIKPGLTKACFDNALIGFRYRFKSLIPSIEEVGPIKIDSGNIEYTISETEEKKEEKKAPGELLIPDIILPSFLKKSRFFPIEVALDKMNIRLPNGLISGKLVIKAAPNDKQLLQDIKIEGNIKKSPDPVTADIKLDIKSESGFRRSDPEIDGDIKLNVSGVGKVSLNINLKETDNKKIEFDTKLRFDKGAFNTALDGSGHISNDSILADLNLDLRNSTSFINRVAISNCRLTLDKVGKIGNDGKLDFNCPATVYVKKIDLPDEVDPVYQPPDVLQLLITSKLETFFVPDVDHKTKGNVMLKLSSIHKKLVDTSGHINILLNGTMSNLPKSLNPGADMDLDFKVKEFAHLVRIFSNTKLSMPAPINSLNGELEFSLEGKVPSLVGASRFPVKFETKLTGPDEKIFIDAKGEARFLLHGNSLSDTEVDMDVTLTDIQFPLPSLQIASMPRLSPDSRIKLQAMEKKKEKPPLRYKLELKTPPDHPVKISSNLTNQPIPIHLDLKGDEEIFVGTIGVKDFTLKLFKRKAYVRKIELNLKDPAEASTVSAQIDINVTEYLVKIMIEGLISKPSIWFESKPPLPEEDIISVLLYGEPFDEVDSDMSTNVGSMRAATTNKAMALTTFFVFAATPIQSILYDADTKQVTARFRLGEKTSLSVGSVGDQKQGVGIRRRLGSGWLINTSVDQDNVDDSTSVSTFLEWHKRY